MPSWCAGPYPVGELRPRELEGFDRVEVSLDRVVEDTSNRREELAGGKAVRQPSMPLSFSRSSRYWNRSTGRLLHSAAIS